MKSDHHDLTSGEYPRISNELGRIFNEWQKMKMKTITREILANLKPVSMKIYIDQFVNLTSTPFFAAFPPQTFLCSVLASTNIYQVQDQKSLDATRGLAIRPSYHTSKIFDSKDNNLLHDVELLHLGYLVDQLYLIDLLDIGGLADLLDLIDLFIYLLSFDVVEVLDIVHLIDVVDLLELIIDLVNLIDLLDVVGLLDL